MIGRNLSHYRVLEEISRGGMGIVYRAQDLKLDRQVALKVLLPDLVADSGRKQRSRASAHSGQVPGQGSDRALPDSEGPGC